MDRVTNFLSQLLELTSSSRIGLFVALVSLLLTHAIMGLEERFVAWLGATTIGGRQQTTFSSKESLDQQPKKEEAKSLTSYQEEVPKEAADDDSGPMDYYQLIPTDNRKMSIGALSDSFDELETRPSMDQPQQPPKVTKTFERTFLLSRLFGQRVGIAIVHVISSASAHSLHGRYGGCYSCVR